MPLDKRSAKFLTDILTAADVIKRATRDKTQQAYLDDVFMRSAVQWNFVVIGEALSQLRQHNPAVAERIGE